MLRNNIGEQYLKCKSYSDHYRTYEIVFENNLSVDKNTGLTNHIERWWLTLRNRIGRFTRKTISFSKSEFYHTAAL
jgi:IS1 family transposase